MRLRITEIGDQRVAEVTLSRRNLLALLRKLELHGSGREIWTEYDCPEGWILIARAEDDDEHYAEREAPPGPMRPASELFIALAEREGMEPVVVGPEGEQPEHADPVASEGVGGRSEGEEDCRRAMPSSADDLDNGERDPGQ